MTKDEALRLAEEAIMDELEAVTDEEFEDAAAKLDDALRAIWKALKEPTIRKNLTVEPVGISKTETTSEPVAWMSPNKERLEFSRKDTVYGSHTIPLYTTPQPRQDVDLTDDELFDISEEFGEFKYGDAQGDKRLGFARAVIAKYKEKNK